MNIIGLSRPVFVFVILVLSAPAVQADVGIVEGDKSIPNMAQWPHLEISGNISSADADFDRLLKLVQVAMLSSNVLVAGTPAPQVMLNSSGGDVRAAMEIGRMLRAFNAVTIVGVNSECSSACVLILAAGARRIVFSGGRVGVHRPYFEESLFAGLSTTQARDKYAEMERRVKNYLKELSMPEALFEKMRSVPSRRLVYLKENELEELSLVGFDPAMEELERAKEKEHFGSETAKYKYLNDIRNCLDLGKSYDVCENIAGQAYKRSNE